MTLLSAAAVTNVAALNALTSADMASALTMLGYSNVGDGGEGLLVLATTGPVDNGYVFTDMASRFWKRANVEEVHLKHFGAAGNGVTDDTAAIVAFLAFVSKVRGGGIAVVPPGNYVHTGFTIPNRVVLCGQNWQSTAFKLKAGTNLTAQGYVASIQSENFQYLSSQYLSTNTGPSGTGCWAAIDLLAGGPASNNLASPGTLPGTGTLTLASSVASFTATGTATIDTTPLALINWTGKSGSQLTGVTTTSTASYTASNVVTSIPVPHQFGLVNIAVDGNRAAMGSGQGGHGIAFFGKAFTLSNVMIHDNNGIGLYSECAKKTGQSGYYDTPEASITDVWSTQNNKDGIVIYGPHDSVWDRIVASINDGSMSGSWDIQVLGPSSSGSSGANNGSCVIGNLHCYGTPQSLYVDTGVRGGVWITEGPALFDVHSSVMVSTMYIGLGGVTGSQLIIKGSPNNIGMVQGSLQNPQNGVSITGQSTVIGGVFINGNSSTGFGVEVDSNEVSIGYGIVRNFNGVGGVALRLGTSGVPWGLDLNLTLQSAGTGGAVSMDVPNAPVSSRLRLRSINPLTHFSMASVVISTASNDIDIVGCASSGAINYRLMSSAEGRNGVSADRGNAAATLVPGTDPINNLWNTPLTTSRGVFLATSGARDGDKFRVIRGSACTGAFSLNVGSGPLKSLTQAGQWVDVVYNGEIATPAWQLATPFDPPVERPLEGTATWNPPSVGMLSLTTTTVTVTGCALGDIATASFSLDLQQLILTAYVSAANTVTCVLSNMTAAAIDLASGTLTARTSSP